MSLLPQIRLCYGLLVALYFGQNHVVNVDVDFPEFRLRIFQEDALDQVLHHNRHVARRVGLDEARNVTLIRIVPVLNPKPFSLVQKNKDIFSAEFGTKELVSLEEEDSVPVNLAGECRFEDFAYLAHVRPDEKGFPARGLYWKPLLPQFWKFVRQEFVRLFHRVDFSQDKKIWKSALDCLPKGVIDEPLADLLRKLVIKVRAEEARCREIEEVQLDWSEYAVRRVERVHHEVVVCRRGVYDDEIIFAVIRQCLFKRVVVDRADVEEPQGRRHDVDVFDS